MSFHFLRKITFSTLQSLTQDQLITVGCRTEEMLWKDARNSSQTKRSLTSSNGNYYRFFQSRKGGVHIWLVMHLLKYSTHSKTQVSMAVIHPLGKTNCKCLLTTRTDIRKHPTEVSHLNTIKFETCNFFSFSTLKIWLIVEFMQRDFYTNQTLRH